jgi:hypothetical protein
LVGESPEGASGLFPFSTEILSGIQTARIVEDGDPTLPLLGDVDPPEVEKVIGFDPRIAEAVVVGVPDPERWTKRRHVPFSGSLCPSFPYFSVSGRRPTLRGRTGRAS